MTEARAFRRVRILRLVAGLLLVLAVALAAYWFFTRGPGQHVVSPAGSTVLHFAGNGDRTTDSFSVRQGWAIRWESTAPHFAFAIGGDRDFGKVIDVDQPGSGTTSPTGAGTFYLAVTSDGPWTIDVTQGD
jgi:hypothetical protein